MHYDSAAALWIDEESFLLQLRFSVFQFDARGRLRATFPSPARRMRSVHGRFVVFEGWHLPERMRSPSEYSREEIGPPREVAIYDLQAAAFLSRWPDEVPAVGVIDDRAIVDRRAHLISKDPPPRESAALAWTRDARFLWFGTVFGGSRVMEMTKLIPYIVPSCAPLHADDVAGAALGVSDRMEWRFVHNNGVLTDGEQRIADLGPARAYAFSPSCKQIVRVNTSDMTGEILDGGGGRIRGFEVPDE